MKKFKQVVTAVVASSIFSMTTVVFAGEPQELDQPGFHHHFRTDDGPGDLPKHEFRDRGPGGYGRLPLHILNLTDSQKQTLDAARAERRPAMKEAHEKLRAAREALDKAGDQNADDATLNKLAANLASIIAQQEVSRIKAHREFLNILTPEQQEKLAAFEGEHKGPKRWKDRERNGEKAKEQNVAPKNTTKN